MLNLKPPRHTPTLRNPSIAPWTPSQRKPAARVHRVLPLHVAARRRTSLAGRSGYFAGRRTTRRTRRRFAKRHPGLACGLSLCASIENQAALMRHETREVLVSQRTQLLNSSHGHLVEVGVIAPQCPRHARELAGLIEVGDESIPIGVCKAEAPLVVQLRNLDDRSPGWNDRHRGRAASWPWTTYPTIGDRN